MKTDLKIKVKGISLNVDLTRNGDFTTEWLGEEISAASFSALNERVAKLSVDRPAKASVPAFLVNPFGSQRAQPLTLVGIHSGNGDILGRDENGKAVRNNNRGLFLQINEFELKEYNALIDVQEQATKAVKDFQEFHRIDPTEVIRIELKGGK